jgi:hypothetical protein
LPPKYPLKEFVSLNIFYNICSKIIQNGSENGRPE